MTLDEMAADLAYRLTALLACLPDDHPDWIASDGGTGAKAGPMAKGLAAAYQATKGDSR